MKIVPRKEKTLHQKICSAIVFSLKKKKNDDGIKIEGKREKG